MKLWSRLSQLIFIPWCVACDERIEPEQVMCPACAISLYELGAACPTCAEPIEGEDDILCRRCRRTEPPFEAMFAPYRYGGQLAVALRLLKYSNRPDIARTLAPLVRPLLHAVAETCDLAIPVPLHRRRLVARGFNQSVLLARYAARGSRLRIDQLSLRRTRATAPQSGLAAAARTDNVADAFAVPRRRRKRIEGRTILLIDDVVTTGATMRAAAAALREAGAAAVVGFCVARAEF